MKKLNVKALALSTGLSFGVFIMLLGWTAYWGWGDKVVDVLSSAYIGYAPSFTGGIIGGLWAFVDMAIGAAIIAYLYNRFNK